jgi:hypothetical protein
MAENSSHTKDNRKATLATAGITTFLLKPNEISVLVLESAGVRKYSYSNL